MDRTPEELMAQYLVASCLISEGILVASPCFDQLGGDLLGFTNVGDKAAIGRIQCKYRDCSKNTSVVINETYIKGAFVLFLYLITKHGGRLVCLLPDEIRKYAKIGDSRGKSVFRISLTERSALAMIADAELEFNASKAVKINTLMKESSVAASLYREFRDLTSLADIASKARERIGRLRELIHKWEILEQQIASDDEQIRLLKELEELHLIHGGVNGAPGATVGGGRASE